jgi:hypothetical protein
MALKKEPEKGIRYTATHKETKEKVSIVGVNSEADIALIDTIPATLDKLSHYGALKADGTLTEKDIKSRDEFFGSNWDN